MRYSLCFTDCTCLLEINLLLLLSGFRSFKNSTSKRVLNLLEPVKLTVWKFMIARVTVVKFRVNYGGGNGAGCFEVKLRADTAKFTNVIVTRLRKCSDLIREGKVFVENKKFASRVGCSKRAVLYFTELLFKSNKKKFSFRRVDSEKIGSHPARKICCRAFCK